MFLAFLSKATSFSEVREVPGFRDRVAYTMLEHMGKQTYLTPLEEKLLQVIEQEYGV